LESELRPNPLGERLKYSQYPLKQGRDKGRGEEEENGGEEREEREGKLWLPCPSSGHTGRAALVSCSMDRLVPSAEAVKALQYLVTSVSSYFSLF